MSNEVLPVVSIDQADAMELIGLLEFVEAWLAHTNTAVGDHYRRFVGTDTYPLSALRADLLAWATRLALAPASPAEAHRCTQAYPDGAG